MPKIVPALTDIAVRNLKKPGLHTVGGVTGLKLQVTASGARSWILRATIAGKVRDIGLGSCSNITLKQARELAREMHQQIQQGNDPVHERRQKRSKLASERAKVKSFDQCAEEYISLQESKWKGPKQAAQWRASLRDYASPFIGRLSIADIDTSHIVDVLQPIWVTKTETATRVRGRIERILSFATTSGYRKGDNPARLSGHLDNLLPKASMVKQKNHHAALPYHDIGRFMVDLKTRNTTASRALAFIIFTASRSGEVRGAKWTEINFNATQWTIPASRMKAKREHVVPLSKEALAILKNQKAEGIDSEYVFPGARGGEMSDMTISKLVKSMHKKASERGLSGYVDSMQGNKIATPHGFRSTFRDWAGEQTNFQRDVIEHALAHQLKDKAEAAYQRKTSIPKRIKLMQAWADYCLKK